MMHVQKAADRLLAYIDKAFDLNMMNQGTLITPCISLDIQDLLTEVASLIPGGLTLSPSQAFTIFGNELSLAFVFYALGVAAASTSSRLLQAQRVADKIAISVGKSEISQVEQAVISDILAFHGGSFGASTDGSWTATLPVRAQRPSDVHKGVFGFLGVRESKSDENSNLAHSLALVALYLKYPFRCIQTLTSQSLAPENKTQTKQLSLVQRCAVRILAFAEEIEDAMLFMTAKPSRSTVYLQNVVSEVCETLGQAKDKRTQQPLKKEDVSVFNEVAGNLPEISGDQEKIRKSLIHVVENSLKFTAKGHVRIFSKITKAAVAISVQDTGSTKYAEISDFKRMFTPFVRHDAHKFLGLGLGLKIVYEVIRMHAGRIDISVSDGLLLTLWFPREPIDPPFSLDVFDMSVDIPSSRSAPAKPLTDVSSSPPPRPAPVVTAPPPPAVPVSVVAPAAVDPSQSAVRPSPQRVERPTHGAAVQMVELDGLSSHLQVELELKNAQVEQLERQVEKLRSELLRERWHRRDLERKLDRMVGQVEMEKITNPKVSTLSELLM